MAVSYEPFAITLIKRKTNKETLIKKGVFSRSTAAKLGKDDYVSLEVIDRLCSYLECRIEDVVEHVPDPKKAPNS